MTDELRAEAGDWSDFGDETQNGGEKKGNKTFPKAEYFRMGKPGTYIVRLVGKHVKFRRFWKPYKILTHDSLQDKDPAWKAGFYPNKRYAINIIDKTGLEDGQTGGLKIMEAGKTIFEAFSLYKETTGIDPTGPKGPDFAIKVKIPTKSNGELDRFHTEYSVMPLGEAKYTDEEKKALCKTDDEGNIIKGDNGKPLSNLYPLTKIFKPASIEKMTEMWDALPSDAKVPPPKKEFKNSYDQSSSQPAIEQKSAPTSEGQITEEPVSTVDASSDELFDNGDSKSSDSDDSTDLF